MPRLWLWNNGDTAILDMPPFGVGQWVANCQFCGTVPEIINGKIFCSNTDCINNRSYTFEEWHNRGTKITYENARTGKIFITLEERVKRLEERLHKIDGITPY